MTFKFKVTILQSPNSKIVGEHEGHGDSFTEAFLNLNALLSDVLKCPFTVESEDFAGTGRRIAQFTQPLLVY